MGAGSRHPAHGVTGLAPTPAWLRRWLDARRVLVAVRSRSRTWPRTPRRCWNGCGPRSGHQGRSADGRPTGTGRARQAAPGPGPPGLEPPEPLRARPVAVVSVLRVPDPDARRRRQALPQVLRGAGAHAGKGRRRTDVDQRRTSDAAPGQDRAAMSARASHTASIAAGAEPVGRVGTRRAALGRVAGQVAAPGSGPPTAAGVMDAATAVRPPRCGWRRRRRRGVGTARRAGPGRPGSRPRCPGARPRSGPLRAGP